METTENLATEYPDDADLFIEFNRVEDLRKFHQRRLLNFIVTDPSRAKDEVDLCKLAENRATELWEELNRRGWLDR
jgi:hypothetical protein